MSNKQPLSVGVRNEKVSAGGNTAHHHHHHHYHHHHHCCHHHHHHRRRRHHHRHHHHRRHHHHHHHHHHHRRHHHHHHRHHHHHHRRHHLPVTECCPCPPPFSSAGLAGFYLVRSPEVRAHASQVGVQLLHEISLRSGLQGVLDLVTNARGTLKAYEGLGHGAGLVNG